MSRLIRCAALVGVMLGGLAAGAEADHTPAPVKAQIAFVDPIPSGARYLRTAPIPIRVIVELDESVTQDDVVTSAGFSTTEFWRKLYFTHVSGAEVSNRTEAHVHANISRCFSRRGALQRFAIPVLPVEVLRGPPAGPNDPPKFRVVWELADARTVYDLSRTGTYQLEARIHFQAIVTREAVELEAVLITDCDQLPGQQLLNVADTGGRHGFVIRSNRLEFSIVDDLTPPTTTVVQDPAAPSDPARQGWTPGRAETGDVKVTFTAVDNEGGTGVKHIRINDTAVPGATAERTVSSDGETTLSYQAEDHAGNVEALKPHTVKLDRTAPSIALEPASQAFLLNQAVSIVFSATDPVPSGRTASGLAGPAQAAVRFPDGTEQTSMTSPVAVTLAQVGLTRVTVRAADVAGNVGIRTADYTVGFDFRGFNPPLVNDTACTAPPCRTFKLGNTIPVKFKLLDAAGTPVRTAVATISVTRLSDGTTTPPDLDLGTGAGDTGNRFRYDVADDQYIFNLDTRALGTTGNYRINVQIQGETNPHTIVIGLR